MTIQPLNDDIIKLWNNPDPMLDIWRTGEHKQRHERLVADWVGSEGQVADLGCGAGRLIGTLNPSVSGYWGFDGSNAMVQRAKEAHPAYSFAVVDMFQYVSDRRYNTAVMLDVAQHQNQPLASILRVMQLWDADRYLASLLVGSVREELSMSVVVPLGGLLDFLDQVSLQRMYMERCGIEKFSWVLMDLER